MFQKTELSDVLTEICKMDPHFNKEAFLKECEFEIIPNILEVIILTYLSALEKLALYITFKHCIFT